MSQISAVLPIASQLRQPVSLTRGVPGAQTAHMWEHRHCTTEAFGTRGYRRATDTHQLGHGNGHQRAHQLGEGGRRC